LEPLSGYLSLAQALYEEGAVFDGAWNFGPQDSDVIQVQEIVNLLMENWEGFSSWEQEMGAQPHEAHSLMLDCAKASRYLGWAPKWNLSQAIRKIIQWQIAYQNQDDMKAVSIGQIESYQNSKILGR
jgi:CDP-glucose 4,6-dehydratase